MQLSNEPHNAYIKCFASRKSEKKSAFKVLIHKNLYSFNEKCRQTIEGLLHYWFGMKGEAMKIELTPEKVTEMGKEWKELVLAGLTPEDVLSRFSADDVLSRFSADDVLSRFSADDVLSRFSAEDVLSRFSAEEMLSGLSIKEIEAYLKNVKQKKVFGKQKGQA